MLKVVESQPNLLSGEWRKIALGFSGLFLIAFVSIYSGVFRSDFHVLLFLKDLSILGLWSLGLSLIFLVGSFDLSAGGLYLLCVALIKVWRESRFGLENDYGLDLMVFAATFTVGIVLAALNGWLVSKRARFSAPLTLAVAIVLGGFGTYLLPEVGPWTESWYLTEVMISPDVLFVAVLIVMLAGAIVAIKYYWPRWVWLFHVFALWVGGLLAVFVIYEYKGLPLIAAVGLAALVLYQLLVMGTAMGRRILAVGDNRVAARLAGISVTQVYVFVFAFLGGVVALASLFETKSFGANESWQAYARHFDAMLVCLLSGFSILGGLGGLSGLISGVLFISALNLLHDYLGMPLHLLLLIKAILFLGAILFDPGRFRQRELE